MSLKAIRRRKHADHVSENSKVMYAVWKHVQPVALGTILRVPWKFTINPRVLQICRHFTRKVTCEFPRNMARSILSHRIDVSIVPYKAFYKQPVSGPFKEIPSTAARFDFGPLVLLKNRVNPFTKQQILVVLLAL